jgi:Flp pilus assembly protein TadG
MRTPTPLTHEDGQATAELALVLPVLTVLLFAIVQFGITFNHYLTLTDAVRAGARQAAVSRPLADPRGATISKVLASAQGMTTPDLVIGVTAPDGSAATWSPGTDVKVTASYPYAIDILGLPVASGRIASTTVERVE